MKRFCFRTSIIFISLSYSMYWSLFFIPLSWGSFPKIFFNLSNPVNKSTPPKTQQLVILVITYFTKLRIDKIKTNEKVSSNFFHSLIFYRSKVYTTLCSLIFTHLKGGGGGGGPFSIYFCILIYGLLEYTDGKLENHVKKCVGHCLFLRLFNNETSF